MVLFGPWNGPFRMPEWYILQRRKIFLKCKSLIFNILYCPLIFSVFAPKGKSVRKYSLIFRGRKGNWGRKIKIRLQIESVPYRFYPNRSLDVLRFSFYCPAVRMTSLWKAWQAMWRQCGRRDDCKRRNTQDGEWPWNKTDICGLMIIWI